MKYQMVIQIPASTNEFDRLIAFEEYLEEVLAKFAVVDGHDLGSGEFNVFVLTDDPRGAFERVQVVAKAQALQHRMRVAYRDLLGDDYVILWPPDLKEFCVV